jgi:hypothetical protein
MFENLSAVRIAGAAKLIEVGKKKYKGRGVGAVRYEMSGAYQI